MKKVKSLNLTGVNESITKTMVLTKGMFDLLLRNSDGVVECSPGIFELLFHQPTVNRMLLEIILGQISKGDDCVIDSVGMIVVRATHTESNPVTLEDIVSLIKTYRDETSADIDVVLNDIGKALTAETPLGSLNSRLKRIITFHYGTLDNFCGSLSEFGASQIYGVGDVMMNKLMRVCNAHNYQMKPLPEKVTNETLLSDLHITETQRVFWESVGIKTVGVLLGTYKSNHSNYITRYGVNLLRKALIDSEKSNA